MQTVTESEMSKMASLLIINEYLPRSVKTQVVADEPLFVKKKTSLVDSMLVKLGGKSNDK